MPSVSPLQVSPWLFADAIDNFRNIGVIVGPVIGLLFAWGVMYLRGGFTGARQGRERLAEEMQGKSLYPIASHCPGCGSVEYSKAKDQEGAFIVLFDRICKRCGTRYTPPIPKWLCFALVPFGIVLALAAVPVRTLLHANNSGAMGVALPVMCVLAGAAVVALGIGKSRVQSPGLSSRGKGLGEASAGQAEPSDAADSR